MGGPIRVHLTGGEQSGWALDADLATTRAALRALDGQVELTTLEDADVVHSVWEEPILRLDPRRLEGKRVVSHLCNELIHTYEMPVMVRAAPRIGLWVAISREAEATLAALRLPGMYIPYTVDPTVFTEAIPGADDRGRLRARFGIPADAYVIGNFMRDARATDLTRPKPQKGAELLVAILRALHARGLPVHALLAGPRRHWVRRRLREAGVPFTFVGQETAGDDVAVNILPPDVVNLLYHLSDLHLVTSRWEGGPRAVLEAGATRTPILSTPVGMAPDVLEPGCLYRAVDEGIELITADVRDRRLGATVEPQFQRVRTRHVPEANGSLLRELYDRIAAVPVVRAPALAPARRLPVSRRLGGTVSMARRLARTAMGRPPRPGDGLCIGLWHEFHKPPYGGGNQFMRALGGSLRRQGVRVVVNRMTAAVDVHLCNSAWFDLGAFEQAARHRRVRMIHRVGGPVALYRGTDWAEDERIHGLNQRHASATVFQSAFSLREMTAHGMDFVRPMIIRNAPDPAIFHPPAARPALPGRRLRVMASAWSDNPRKGGPLFKWLDEHLDWSRFEFTFVGRVQQTFDRIRHVPPQDSHRLAELLRAHDLYLAPNRNEPASNALLEALTCGLPVLYLDSGGSPELVVFGGLPFTDTSDILPQLDRLATNLDTFRSCIWVPTIDEIARQYIELARLLVNDLP
jgi:glycosyltransferase involved in cell wall biosynthesis